ncbi:MAG: phage regulatory CII family protein [Candidatus Sedimenticola sp. (ex Thyasira tokunagai)]
MLLQELDEELHTAALKYKSGARRGGGIPRLAAEMGMHPQTLVNKLNTTDASKDLTKREFFAVVRLLDSDYARDLTAEIMEITTSSKEEHQNLTLALLHAEQANAGVSEEILNALSDDGMIDDVEMARIRRAAFIKETANVALVNTAQKEHDKVVR